MMNMSLIVTQTDDFDEFDERTTIDDTSVSLSQIQLNQNNKENLIEYLKGVEEVRLSIKL
jgi:hypothetical protein